MTIKQTISTAKGQLVALTTTGAVSRQQRADAPSEALEWARVDLSGVEGRVAEIIARPTDNSLVVRTTDGRYYEQHSSYYSRALLWRELAGP